MPAKLIKLHTYNLRQLLSNRTVFNLVCSHTQFQLLNCLHLINRREFGLTVQYLTCDTGTPSISANFSHNHIITGFWIKYQLSLNFCLQYFYIRY